MEKTRICFVGGGNMARSLIGGLIADGVEPGSLSAADPDPRQRQVLRERFGIATQADNAEAAANADTVVLAVKPQVLREVARDLGPALAGRRTLVVSIAAGIRIADLNRWLGDGTAIVRAMPNTPSLLGCGVSALFANKRTSTAQRETAEALMRAVGAAFWVRDERLLDAVTAVSGSGPAYFFLFMEMIAEAGERIGLDADIARLLTVETALGAARMALESREELGALRRRVTSPGGTTAAALEVLDSDAMRRMIDEAVARAHERSVKLASEFGRN